MGKILAFLLTVVVCTALFTFWLKSAIVEKYSGGNETRYDFLYLLVAGVLVATIGYITRTGAKG